MVLVSVVLRLAVSVFVCPVSMSACMFYLYVCIWLRVCVCMVACMCIGPTLCVYLALCHCLFTPFVYIFCCRCPSVSISVSASPYRSLYLSICVHPSTLHCVRKKPNL